jgi:RAQPRD family integrative conjugative element protein
MKAITAIILLLFSTNILANENTDLARINSILNSVYPLIAKAQKEAHPNSRIKFHYNWLRSDIAKIQAGIARKIHHLPQKPAIIIPLKKSYLTAANKTAKTGEAK